MPAQTPTISVRWVRNQFDTAPPLRLMVYDEAGAPMDLVTLGITATIDIAYQSADHFWSPYLRLITERPMETTAVVGQLQMPLEEGDLDVPGQFDAKVRIIYPDGSDQTIPSEYPLKLTVKPRVGGP